MENIIYWVISSIVVLFFLALAIEYWYFTLFFIGIVLINIFTFWAVILIFILGVSIQVYDHVKKETINLHVFTHEILFESAKLSAIIVGAALIINLIFQAVGGSGGGYVECTRATPQGC